MAGRWKRSFQVCCKCVGGKFEQQSQKSIEEELHHDRSLAVDFITDIEPLHLSEDLVSPI